MLRRTRIHIDGKKSGGQTKASDKGVAVHHREGENSQIFSIVTRLSPEKIFLRWKTTASTLNRKPFLRRRNTFVGRLGDRPPCIRITRPSR